ncbi:MAG: hypothetical protein E6J85_03835 [Deltaproteobacteria bacterium]|nr:MAG: hypothetical protein E6J85_03835 [Deltaproteobacteria bacterium]
MIRIRPGRSWRHNPGYVGKLRRLEGPHLQRFEGSGILDVLGIEVDGVDIAAGVGEAEILVAMDEVCRALARLRSGSPAAQATVGRGPTELLLEARGADVLLALVSLAPPARFLASGLLLDGERLRAAAASAARALADDLLSISPALSGSPLLARLRGPLRAPLRKGAAQGTAPWPPAVPGRGFVARGAARGVRCEIQVPEESAWRLAGRADVPDAPLAALLGTGSLALRVGGSPALSWESPPYLALRDLVRSASGVVSAWEAGDADFTLRFGAADLHCDLTRDEVRANGWRGPVALPAPALATALAGAARAYATKALALGGEAEELSDLRDSARRIEIHCKDLASGNLRRTRSAALVPPPRKAPPQKGPLSRGRVRRLVYREAWKTEPGDPPEALSFCGGALIAGSKRGVRALDAATGREIFRADCEAFAHAANGDDLFLASHATLSRIDPSTGERRWQRRMRSSTPLWPVARGLVRPTEDGIVCVSDVGGVAFGPAYWDNVQLKSTMHEAANMCMGKNDAIVQQFIQTKLAEQFYTGAMESCSALAARGKRICSRSRHSRGSPCGRDRWPATRGLPSPPPSTARSSPRAGRSSPRVCPTAPCGSRPGCRSRAMRSSPAPKRTMRARRCSSPLAREEPAPGSESAGTSPGRCPRKVRRPRRRRGSPAALR